MSKLPSQNQFVYPWIEKVILFFALLLIVFFLILSTQNVSFRHYFFKTGNKELSQIPFGKVVVSEGIISRQKRFDTEFLPLRSTDAVYPNDSIMTGKDSSAIVELDNGERIEIGPNSLVKLDFDFDFSFSELIPKQIIPVVSLPEPKKKEVKIIAKAGAPVKVFKPKTLENGAKPIYEPVVIVPTQTTATAEEPIPMPTPTPTKVIPLAVNWETPQALDHVLLTPNELKESTKRIPLSISTNKAAQLKLKIIYPDAKKKPELRDILIGDELSVVQTLEFHDPGEYRLELFNEDDEIVEKRKLLIPKYSKVIELLSEQGTTSRLTGEEPEKVFPGIKLRWNVFMDNANYKVSILQNGTRKVKQRFLIKRNEIIVNKGAVPKEPISYVVEQELPRGFVAISDVKTVDFEYTAPDLMNPANSAVIQSKGTKSKVFFTWTKTNFTSGYEIQISISRDFSSLYLKKLVKDNVLLLVSIPQGEYFWRVRAFSSKKLSPYSAVRALSIQ